MRKVQSAMSGQLEIDLLGGLELRRDGTAISLPPSRKTRALLGYLVVNQQPTRRERLCELLWDIPDDPRGALRWSLTKLRGLVDDEDRRRILSDRDQVEFEANGARVDWHQAFAPADDDLDQLDLGALTELAALFRGPFLQDADLSSCPEFNVWLVAQRDRAQMRHKRILSLLVDRLFDQPDSALPHARTLAEQDGLDESAHALVVRLLARSGRRREAERYARTALLMLEAAGIPTGGLLEAAAGEVGPAPPTDRVVAAGDADGPALRQKIRFCAARDGTRIAWSTAGQGPPLVKTANWLNHLEYDWESPVWSHLMQFLVSDHTLIRYDERGNGLSDWNIETADQESFVSDLEAVVEAAGLDRFPMLAISQGCVVAAHYVARNPGRVSRLIMHGGYPAGWRRRSDSAEAEAKEALLTLVKTGWGAETSAFRQLFSALIFPGATPELHQAFSELQTKTTSPENALMLMNAFGDLDAYRILADIDIPVLVTHCRGDLRVPFELGRELAMEIPNARFVALDSVNHVVLETEPAWQRFIDEVSAFLAEDDD